MRKPTKQSVDFALEGAILRLQTCLPLADEETRKSVQAQLAELCDGVECFTVWNEDDYAMSGEGDDQIIVYPEDCNRRTVIENSLKSLPRRSVHLAKLIQISESE